ncbi:MAG: IS21-like element helper ATPase IstB [Deltaproteobacteria bacterium]|nr:IS21-like element helper ATPase IstB [Deltaproteobacteria bacterium]
MLNEPTIEKLQALRLTAMADAWRAQQKEAAISALGFDERFALLVEAEHGSRENRKIARLLKDAELRIPSACPEDVETSGGRGVDRALMRQLGTCGWITEHLNVLITGPTGVGKSHIACALGQVACRKGRRVLYRRMPRLLDELGLGRADGTYARRLGQCARADLLILDDLGLGTLGERQRHDLLEVLEDRYGRVSTIVTSQMPIAKWHDWIGEPTVADAILDRLVHNAYKIALQGASKRKPKDKD